MASYRYVIPGEPIRYCKDGNRVSSSYYNESKIRWIIEIERQHDLKPMLRRPLAAEYEFFYCTLSSRAEISSLVKFVNSMLSDLVFPSPSIIVSLQTKKEHVKGSPCTIITLKEQ